MALEILFVVLPTMLKVDSEKFGIYSIFVVVPTKVLSVLYVQATKRFTKCQAALDRERSEAEKHRFPL